MTVFPSSPAPRIGSAEELKYNVLKNSFEGNYLQVRRASTRGRRTFTLKYTSITNPEFDALQAFFETNVGMVFDFIHPLTAETHKVTFQNDALQRTYTSQTRCDTEIILEGV